MPLSESPMIYCEIWISNVTETTFDFLIKEVVMATDERTIVLPLSTAKIVNNGWGAIYEGKEFTLSFEFPDAPDIFVHWLIGVYEKRYDIKEEIIYAGLTNTLEFIMALWIIRNLWFVHRLMEL